MMKQIEPLKLGKKVDAFRARDFAAMTKAERHAYGDAVERAIRGKQMAKLHGRAGNVWTDPDRFAIYRAQIAARNMKLAA
jgi:hypothetical protein